MARRGHTVHGKSRNIKKKPKVKLIPPILSHLPNAHVLVILILFVNAKHTHTHTQININIYIGTMYHGSNDFCTISNTCFFFCSSLDNNLNLLHGLLFLFEQFFFSFAPLYTVHSDAPLNRTKTIAQTLSI